jgi:hypothetical protein
MENLDKFQDYSGPEAPSAATRKTSMITKNETSKYDRDKIQSIEILDLLAWLCQ